MSTSSNRGMLSIGAFLVIVVVSIVLGLTNLIPWTSVAPLIIALCGIWVLVLASMQVSKPEKYGRSSFSLAAWGAFLIAAGGALFLVYYNWIYSILIILVALAGAAIAAGLRKK